jgi:hypothetical protein
MDDFDRRVPESRALDRAQLEVPEGGLVEALRRAENTAASLPSIEPAPEPRASVRTQSGMLRLSEIPETDVGEAAARAVTGGEAATPATEQRPNLLIETPSAPPVNVTMPALSGGSSLAKASGSLDSPPPLTRASRPPEMPVVKPLGPAANFSFASLFPAAEQGVVQVVESALALGDPMAAITSMDQLVARALASGAALVGSSHDAPRDPALVALLLGLEPRRYLKFRSWVREARAGTLLSTEAGLLAYAFVLDLRRALRDIS